MQPQTIRPSVSPATIGKVTRLFNGSIGDILNELLQNARRAGATKVDIAYDIEEDAARVIVTDDGCGIPDPQGLLALGSSQWSGEIAQDEDPAGMGVFALAGKEAVIVSRHAGEAEAWRIEIPKDAWTGTRDLRIESARRMVGTTIAFVVPDLAETDLKRAIADAAHYYPLPVTCHGSERKREDFLADAVHIVEWRGSRIGVFTGRTYIRVPSVNFYGLTICTALPELSETLQGGSYYAKVDVGTTHELQLVLPARKEFVRNAAFEELKRACQTAIFEAIAKRPSHRLSFKDWRRARKLGVDLSEAERLLPAWRPDVAGDDWLFDPGADITVDERTILVDEFEPAIGQGVRHALRDQPGRAHLAQTHTAYTGYKWYDALPRLTAPEFVIRDGEGNITCGASAPMPKVEEHIAAEAITLGYTIVDPKSGTEATCHVATDLAFILDAEGWCEDIETIRIAYATDAEIDPEDLVDLLEAICFCASDDSDADSWDTQHDRFLRDARELATRVLVGEDAAICSQFRDILARSRWILPKGKMLSISLSDETFDVRVADASRA